MHPGADLDEEKVGEQVELGLHLLHCDADQARDLGGVGGRLVKHGLVDGLGDGLDAEDLKHADPFAACICLCRRL